ncbi:MAG: VCBS repeat-containing protein [Gemmataceae bacterium]
MTSRSTRLAVEVLDARTMPSTVAYGDFNGDGRVDVAAVTSPTTVTVSLANPDGSYTVSATLTAPKNQPIQGIEVSDVNGDGKPDVTAGGFQNNRFYGHVWLGNGDGTFGDRVTDRSGRIPKWWT